MLKFCYSCCNYCCCSYMCLKQFLRTKLERNLIYVCHYLKSTIWGLLMFYHSKRQFREPKNVRMASHMLPWSDLSSQVHSYAQDWTASSGVDPTRRILRSQDPWSEQVTSGSCRGWQRRHGRPQAFPRLQDQHQVRVNTHIITSRVLLDWIAGLFNSDCNPI